MTLMRMRYILQKIIASITIVIGASILLVSFPQTTLSDEIDDAYSTGKALFDAQRYTKAVPYFRNAAAAGNHGAMNYLGYMYDTGKGVTQDYTQAFNWYMKSAKAGNIISMNNLGLMYLHAKGRPIDYQKASYWFNQGASAGNAESMGYMGYMYEHGLGVEQNLETAINWYFKAGAHGDEWSKNHIKKILKK